MSTELERALNKIVKKDDPKKPITPKPPAQEIPASRGTGTPAASVAPSASGGIASPLTEGTVASPGTYQRTFQASPIFDSSGLFSIPAIATLKMVDANGAEVHFVFQAPP